MSYLHEIHPKSLTRTFSENSTPILNIEISENGYLAQLERRNRRGLMTPRVMLNVEFRAR